jgi:hypothetical protein
MEVKSTKLPATPKPGPYAETVPNENKSKKAEVSLGNKFFMSII